MSSKKCIKALHSYPTAPPVSEVSRSFPYNLRKHHTPSYGCTFPKCHRIFGVGSDWRHHENGEHFQEEAYLCQKISPSTLASCNELFYEIGMFKSHLESHHDIIDSEDIADEVQLQRIGRNRQVRFWCGFCEDLITLKEKRNAAWEEGFKHIDDHFQEGKAIEEWLCVEAKKKKGEILQEIDRGYFNEERTDILEGMNLSRSQHPQKREERQASAVPVANSRDARRVLILDDSNPDRLVTLGLDSSLKEDDDGKIESPIFNFYRKKLGSSWSPDSGLVSSIKRLSTVDMDDERGSPSRHENNQSPNEVSESIVQKNVAGKQELPFIGTDPLPSAESISRSTTSIVDSDLEEPQRIQNQIYSSPDENESAPEEDGAFDLFRANQICSQVTSRVAREIVESLLEQSPTGFIECPAGETPCGSASHSSGSNKPKSSPNESNSRKENNSTKRKRSGYQDSGGHEEGSDDGNNGNGPHEHRIWPRCKKRVERRLKCPFLWQEEQHATACKGIGFEDMSRVLTHVKKYHTRPRQCVRCWEEIESQKELEEHLRRNPVCEEVPEPKDGRKGFEKMRELNLRDKPLKDGKNDEEKWKLLFKDLFPEEHEVPSPYDKPWMSSREEKLFTHLLEKTVLERINNVLSQNELRTIFNSCRSRAREIAQAGIQMPPPSSSNGSDSAQFNLGGDKPSIQKPTRNPNDVISSKTPLSEAYTSDARSERIIELERLLEVSEGKVKELETNLASSKEKVKALETSLAEAQKKVQGLETSLTKSGERVKNLETTAFYQPSFDDSDLPWLDLDWP